MTNTKRGTVYIGVTSNLTQRIHEHKTHQFEGFTDKYNCIQLVYYEFHDSMNEAIVREKQMKKWNREWKFRLIESMNAEWKDLYDEVITSHPY